MTEQRRPPSGDRPATGWRRFQPSRDDARRAGVVGDAPSPVVRESGVREVYVADAVAAHYRGHADQFDVARAEAMLPGVLDDPLMVVQGRKAGTAVFVERFDDDHYLLVPIKRLAGELWIETIYIDRVARFHRRAWTLNRLYER